MSASKFYFCGALFDFSKIFDLESHPFVSIFRGPDFPRETAISVYATTFAGIAYSTIPTPIGESDAKNVKNFLVL